MWSLSNSSVRPFVFNIFLASLIHVMPACNCSNCPVLWSFCIQKFQAPYWIFHCCLKKKNGTNNLWGQPGRQSCLSIRYVPRYFQSHILMWSPWTSSLKAPDRGRDPSALAWSKSFESKEKVVPGRSLWGRQFHQLRGSLEVEPGLPEILGSQIIHSESAFERKLLDSRKWPRQLRSAERATWFT